MADKRWLTYIGTVVTRILVEDRSIGGWLVVGSSHESNVTGQTANRSRP